MSEKSKILEIEKKFDMVLEILSSKQSNLPIDSEEIQNSQSFHIFMEKRISNYISMVEEIIGFDEPEIIKKLNKSKEKIKNCISQALFGSESSSWTIFCDYYDIIKQDLHKISALCYNLLKIFSNTVKTPYRIRTLYRGRRSRDIFNDISDSLDLFHIPFQKRFWSKNYRYTKAGYPGLYLGESAYICWAELGYFDLNQFVLASYSFYIEDFKFLDISWRPIEVAKTIMLQSQPYSDDKTKMSKFEWCFSYYDNLLSYIVCIPLIMMCSVEISNKKKRRTFIPEYIFPQFLFRYITEFKETLFHGIKYFSMCRKFGNFEPFSWSDYSLDLLSKNYIMVIPDLSEEGYSENLKKKIEISNPISYQGLIVNQNQNAGGDSYGWENAGAANIPSLTSGNYYESIFGKVEFLLHKMKSNIFRNEKFLFEGNKPGDPIKLEWFLGIAQNSGKIVLKKEEDPNYIIKSEKIEDDNQKQIGKPIIMDRVEFSVKLEASIIARKNMFHIPNQ
jgi:hypothetical protein